MNPEKREGGIMQNFLNEKGEVISSKEEVIVNCLRHLELLSGKIDNEEEILKFKDVKHIQNLMKINEEEIKSMQLSINKEKAITLSGFSLEFFITCKKSELLSDWWRREHIAKLYESIFEARLIPLNKVWP